MWGLLAEDLTEIVCIMLEKLSEQVRACHEYAADAKQMAEAAAGQASKASFLDMEKGSRALARPVSGLR